MNEDATSIRARLAVLAIAIFLPLEILAVVVWLFMAPGFYPTPVVVAAVPLGALSIGLAHERRAAWWIGAPIFLVQGIANLLVLLSKIGRLLVMIDTGRLITESFGTVAINLGVNLVAVALVIMFFSQGVRRRFFRDDLVSRI